MDAFVRAVRTLSNLCGAVAAALIGAGVIVVCEMVIVRYALNENTIWQTDFVTYCLIAATFVGSPYVLMIRGHVNVDVLPHYLAKQNRYWLSLFFALLTLSFFITVTPPTYFLWEEGSGQ